VFVHLLGLYLGDGWLAAMAKGTFSLRISLDQRYPGIIAGCYVGASYWKHWPTVLPQHGRGPKHARPIVLTDWQRRITAAEPEALVRGLIHSDGCRFVAAQRVGGKTYRYSRYSSGRSVDRAGRIW
jgi:hypothetical protein